MDDFERVVQLTEDHYGDRTRIDPDWEGSPLQWLKSIPPSACGAVGRRVVRELLEAEGFNTSGGRINFNVAGIPTVTKTSLRWTNGEFTFQQLKFDTFEIAALLGIEPDAVSLWFVPRTELVQQADGQHGGAEATETAWLRFPASSPPDWLAFYGGSIGDALSSLRRLIEG